MAKIPKTGVRKMLGDVPDDKQFWCNDGRTLKNLAELEAALEEMSDDTFRYHATESKNDFSNWVRDVIGDEQLARDLLKSVSRFDAARKVNSRIAQLRR